MPASPGRLALLTPVELDVCRRIIAGHSYDEMARDRACSVNTVKVHATTIYRKVGGSRAGLLSYVARHHPTMLTGRRYETGGDIILYG